MNEILGAIGLTVIDVIAFGVGLVTLVIAIILFVVSKRKKIDIDPKELIKVNDENKSLQKTVSELKNKETFLIQNLETKNNQVQELQKKISEISNNSDPEIMKQVLTDTKLLSVMSELDTTKQELVSVQKKLKNAESDLDDVEDDLEDVQKKLKKKTEENSEMSEKLENLTKDYDKVTTSLQSKEDALKESNETLQVKLGALDFMSAILMAKDIDDTAINNRYRKIDDIVEYVREDFADCLAKNDLYKDESLFGEELDIWAQVSKKTWLKDKISVAFVGEFSAGKTSIVNSIIKANDSNSQLLPTSAKATTAIPTYISASSTGSENYLFFSTDNKLKVLNPKVFEVTKEMLDSVDGEETLFKYFIVSYNNPNLEKLSILDTPGFSSEDKQDAERTIEVINECDALFWVFDVNNGEVNESSLKTIKENLKKPLYVVINKIDTVAPGEVDKVERKITETFKNNGINVVQIIRYSNDPKTVPTETIINALKSVKRTNTTQNYIDNLMKFAKSCVKELEESASSARDEYFMCSNRLDDERENLENCVSIIRDKCVNAGNMPQFKEHFFRGDKFEMDYDTGIEFRALMEEITNEEMPHLSSLVSDLETAVQDYQEADQKDDEANRKKDSIENCVSVLRKKIKAFNSKIEN